MTETKTNPDAFLIVALGASAGGVEALRSFFENVPEHSGMAYIVILHMSPDFDSELVNVLQATTLIPVNQVKVQTGIQPNNIYVISPNHHLTIADGSLIPVPNQLLEDRRAPVDILFRNLANNYKSRAVCVILSGTGANGSMGLKRIKEEGGSAFVQNPGEASFNEMPRNAIATELVDEVLPVAHIPAKIISYRENRKSINIPAEPQERPEEQQQALRDIFKHLRVHTGHDFINYKRPTLLRRIERRMNINNIFTLPDYSSFLYEHPEEVKALLKDLLISVTNFFRDQHAFESLDKKVIHALLKGKTAALEVRIWVAGCATGEEAYSLAMLFAEHMNTGADNPRVQIFATDIDEAAIAHAREGLYSINDAADVSSERLQRFFNKEGERYRVKREIREMVLFATHNFLKDPPFSHLDLVTCRNVLIYLNRNAQERVMETFHFALNTGCYLFLGTSESADASSDLYSHFDRDHHIYTTRPAKIKIYPVPESYPLQKVPVRTSYESAITDESNGRDRLTAGNLHQKLLEQYGPPSLLINEEYEILHVSAKAGKYLQMSGGEPSQNLLKLILPELRLEVHSALLQAVQQQMPVEISNLKVNLSSRNETINIHIRPVFGKNDPARGLILILFEAIAESGNNEKPVIISNNEPMARHLEEELIRLKNQLHNSIEQHEFHAEELKASNEELQAMNEELRSVAEELETSKEELHSMNEELRTVNQELKVKIEETTLAGNNLRNLINSSEIGTIFLDRNFRVAFFTPAARKLFNLLPADSGRPLSDITHRLKFDNFTEAAQKVLETLHATESQVAANDGTTYLMRMLPYRTAEDRINGIVITFIEITELKKAQEDLLGSEERYRSIVSQARAGIAETDFESRFTLVNERFSDMLGYTSAELLNGLKMNDIAYSKERNAYLSLFEKCVNEGTPFAMEEQFLRKDGTPVWISNNVSLIKDHEGRPKRVLTVSLDVSRAKELEKQKDEFIGIASHELKTPVTSIRAYSELLQELLDVQGTHEHQSVIGKLNNQVDRLIELLNALLDTTRITEGKLSLHREVFDLNKLITEQVEELQRTSHAHLLKTNLGETGSIFADRERIAQVISNLVSNAVKYSPDSNEVVISSEDTGDGVRVSVKDFGVGISSDSQNQVFERFFRDKEASDKHFSGLGLGLYIASEIINRHQGEIKVDSKEGEGSVFSFSIPYRTPEE